MTYHNSIEGELAIERANAEAQADEDARYLRYLARLAAHEVSTILPEAGDA